MPRRFARKSEATLERWEREGAPDPKRAREVQWWRDYGREGVLPERARAAVADHRAAFDGLEERLASSEWLIGERLSVLDVAWFITTTRLRTAGYPLGDHPRLLAWHRRLEARPAFREETRDAFALRAVIVPLYQAVRRLQGTSLAAVLADR